MIGKPFNLINPEDETTRRNIGFLLKNEQENKGKDINEFKTAGLNQVTLKNRNLTEAASKFITIFL